MMLEGGGVEQDVLQLGGGGHEAVHAEGVGEEVLGAEGVGDKVVQFVGVEEQVLAGRADVKLIMARAIAELEKCMLTGRNRIEIVLF